MSRAKLEEILERRIDRARENFGTEQSGTVPFPVAIGMLREGPLWSLILTRFADEDEEMYRHRFLFHREKLNDPKGFFLMATVMARIRAYGEEYFKKVGTLAKTEEKNIDNRGRSDKKDNEREDEDGGEDEKEAEEKKPYEGNAQDNSQKRPSRDSSSTQQDSLPLESLEYSACERLVGVRRARFCGAHACVFFFFFKVSPTSTTSRCHPGEASSSADERATTRRLWSSREAASTSTGSIVR